MRVLSIISLIMISFFSYGQDRSATEIVKEFDSPYQPPTILLFKGNTRLDSVSPAISGEFNFTHLGPGIYKLIFSGPQQETKTIHGIVVEKGQVLKLRIRMKGPCLYDYAANYIPTCPKNHTDKIIPIIYGVLIPAKLTADDKQPPQFFPGGCVTTGCDPKFYCTIHKIEF